MNIHCHFGQNFGQAVQKGPKYTKKRIFEWRQLRFFKDGLHTV